MEKQERTEEEKLIFKEDYYKAYEFLNHIHKKNINHNDILLYLLVQRKEPLNDLIIAVTEFEKTNKTETFNDMGKYIQTLAKYNIETKIPF